MNLYNITVKFAIIKKKIIKVPLISQLDWA